MIKTSTTIKSLLILLLSVATTQISAQTVSSFEDITLDQTGVYNGKDQAGSFVSAGITFRSAYDTTYVYWSGGFAASNHVDSNTTGFGNMYSTRAGFAASGTNFAVGQQGAIVVTGGMNLQNVRISNSTYAARSMQFGDQFSKKFGGASGNDEDYFRLIISAYQNGQKKASQVEFYLADYRFANNSEDYILSNWETVNLSALGTADSIEFTLESSDVGQWGINTPTYFCIDNLSLTEGNGIAETTAKVLSAYPNPVVDKLQVNQELAGKTAVIKSVNGVVVSANPIAADGSIEMSNLGKGLYIINVSDDKVVYTQKIIKE